MYGFAVSRILVEISTPTETRSLSSIIWVTIPGLNCKIKSLKTNPVSSIFKESPGMPYL